MSRKSLTTLAVIVLTAAAANSALAGGCGGGRKYYGGASNLHHRYISSHNHGIYKTKNYHREVVVHQPVIVEKHIVDHCHHPKFCLAYVCPGETLPSICAREYGNPNFWTKVAAFNHLPAGAPLAVGQPIKLPTIYDSGRMIPADSPVPPVPAIAVSAGPAAVGLAAPAGPAPQPGFAGGLPQGQPGFAPQQMPQGGPQQQPMQPGQQPSFGQPMQQPQQQQPAMQPNGGQQLNIRQAERVTPTFTIGSQLVIDGQQFGGTPGQVQLVVGPFSVPAAVANWTPSELTIQLPELPLNKTSDARVVVLDSTGKLITQSEIKLTPTSNRLAMGN